MTKTKVQRALSGSPFKTCLKGHETIYEDQYIYNNQRQRVCRQCAEESKTTRRK